MSLEKVSGGAPVGFEAVSELADKYGEWVYREWRTGASIKIMNSDELKNPTQPHFTGQEIGGGEWIVSVYWVKWANDNVGRRDNGDTYRVKIPDGLPPDQRFGAAVELTKKQMRGQNNDS